MELVLIANLHNQETIWTNFANHSTTSQIIRLLGLFLTIVVYIPGVKTCATRRRRAGGPCEMTVPGLLYVRQIGNQFSGSKCKLVENNQTGQKPDICEWPTLTIINN